MLGVFFSHLLHAFGERVGERCSTGSGFSSPFLCLEILKVSISLEILMVRLGRALGDLI